MTTPRPPASVPDRSDGFLTRSRQQRATGFAILGVLASLGLRAWGGAVERAGGYESGDLGAIRTMEICSWALTTAVLVYVALCLIAIDRVDPAE